MQDSKPVGTPASIGLQLHKASEEDECVEQKKYQSAIGSLMYLSVCTRPDIAYAVNSLARFTSSPTKEHWTALKCLLRFLKGTPKHGIFFTLQRTDQVPVSVMLTQNGLETWMIASQLQTIFFCSVVGQSYGKVKNNVVSHCQQQKLNMLLCPALLKNRSG